MELHGRFETNQPKPSQAKPNQTKPNQTKPNQPTNQQANKQPTNQTNKHTHKQPNKRTKTQEHTNTIKQPRTRIAVLQPREGLWPSVCLFRLNETLKTRLNTQKLTHMGDRGAEVEPQICDVLQHQRPRTNAEVHCQHILFC